MNRTSNGCCGQIRTTGCPVPMGTNRQCGETQTLRIIHEFKKLYEEKMKQIDGEAGGDCLPGLQAKVSMQQEWIRDLTEQNDMLVRAVEELEMEATDRVAMLEEKLRNSTKAGCEVMQKYRDFNFAINLDETFQNLGYLQNDVRNLLEFIRRARDEGKWSINGLQFYDVTKEDLFGTSCCIRCPPAEDVQMTEELQKKTTKVKELQTKLHEKTQELNALKQSMLDMRNALTVEVAEKHDVILNLRRDVQQLEEQYRQSNKQTQFKDDIIKELRKEIKQLKGEAYKDKNLLCLKSTELENEVNHLITTKDKIIESSTNTNCATWQQSENMNSIKQEISNIKQTIDNDYMLYSILGREINFMILDAHEKDKLLLTQQEVIEFLMDAVMSFYNQLKELRTSSFEYTSPRTQEDSPADLPNSPITFKSCPAIPKGRSATTRKVVEEVYSGTTQSCPTVTTKVCSVNFQSGPTVVAKVCPKKMDEVALKHKIAEQEKEITMMKIAIAEAQKELELLDKQANEYLLERDSYRTKHSEGIELLADMTAKFTVEKEEYETQRKENEDTIECLQKINQGYTEYTCSGSDSRISKDTCMELQRRSPSTTTGFKLKCIQGPKSTNSQYSSVGGWSTTDSTTEQLEDTIHHLSGTVSKMIQKSRTIDCTREQVLELEDELAKTRREREIERAKRNQEVINLKQTISELEKALRNAQMQSSSLEKAVDLYQNSVNVLEASEERARIEICQQRQTIANLQEALLTSKHQLDELQQKASNEVSLSWTSRWLGSSSTASKPANNSNKSVHDV